ncbi:hypothetical protein OAN07_02650 [Candidatus Pelagibacter sp.]|nr:hypothetical protein [Candidatus Pelagibacter sp.]
MKKINIIYLLPAMKKISGGAKVIYNHSKLLNNLDPNLNSTVNHLKKNTRYKIKTSILKKLRFLQPKFSGLQGNKMKVLKNFYPNKKWISFKINSGKSLNFNNHTDFIIIPEIWAHFAEDMKFRQKKINYAIFVQGFFHMNSTDNFLKLKRSYKNSTFILSDSEYSIKCIKEMFPEFIDKIIKLSFSIDHKKFKIRKKINLITYMPRKLPDHAFLLLFYLKNLLPKNWKICPLININQNKLIATLAKSKIFLSFSNFEGIGMPPIEAALSGNRVIGYKGGGGAEYWKSKIFKKIESGEIRDFGKVILQEIKNYKISWLKETMSERMKLAKQYSKTKEIKSLKYLIKKIQLAMM